MFLHFFYVTKVSKNVVKCRKCYDETVLLNEGNKWGMMKQLCNHKNERVFYKRNELNN